MSHGLMKESQEAFPEPCRTMEIVVVPEIQDNPKLPKNIFDIKVYFRAKYTEVNQERVSLSLFFTQLNTGFFKQEFTWESLWGNAGGYIGFFLGVSLMQLPEIILSLFYDIIVVYIYRK